MLGRELSSNFEYGDLLLKDHWRLQGIELKHSTGNTQRSRGWESYIEKGSGRTVEVPETIDSSQTPFEPLILLVPPQLLGTHEATDPSDPENIENGYETAGFKEIDFSEGWKGSPVAVAAHCVYSDGRIVRSDVYPSIYKALKSTENKMAVLENLSYGDLGVLDGHHRAKKSIYSGLKYIPVQLIPYLYDDSVILDTWHSDGNVWSPEQVFECFKVPSQYADAKRTKFGVRGSDGQLRRILDTQPDVFVPLKNLI